MTLLAAAALLGGAWGCDRPDDQPNLAPVSGVVTIDGEAVSGKHVIFSPKEGRASMGTTNEQGEYSLMYTNKWEGAIVGPHDVTISTPVPARDGVPYDENIPPRYNVESDLTAEVEDTNNEIDFDLDSE